MSFRHVGTNAGSGGDTILADQWTDGGASVDTVYGGLVYISAGAVGGTAVYTPVDLTHGLPAQIVAALPTGTNVIGHVVVDSLGGTVTIAGTVPVTGTFWQATQPVSIASLPALPAHQSTNVDQVNGTTTDTNSGNKSAGTLRVVLATDQPALTNKLLVTPDSVALPPHQSANVDQLNGTATDTNSGNKSAGTLRVVLATDQLNGTATDTNSGNKSAGTLRVVLATDQPALTNKLLVTPDSVALPPHQSANVDQLNGTATDTNSGNKSAGTLRVVLATDQPALTNAQPTNATLQTGANNAGFFTPAPAGAVVGATPFHLGGSAASTNATSVNGSACTLWEIIAVNVSTSAVAYLKIFDKASAPTVGTDTPVYVLPLPTAGSANGAGASKTFPVGLKLVNGLAYAITGAMADADATAVAANQVLLSGSYK